MCRVSWWCTAPAWAIFQDPLFSSFARGSFNPFLGKTIFEKSALHRSIQKLFIKVTEGIIGSEDPGPNTNPPFFSLGPLLFAILNVALLRLPQQHERTDRLPSLSTPRHCHATGARRGIGMNPETDPVTADAHSVPPSKAEDIAVAGPGGCGPVAGDEGAPRPPFRGRTRP